MNKLSFGLNLNKQREYLVETLTKVEMPFETKQKGKRMA